MPRRSADISCPTAVPVELAGKWVAWNADHTRVVAHAQTLPQLWQAVQEMHVNDPVFEKIPRANVRFVGVR
jgi:hypothetical protein